MVQVLKATAEKTGPGLLAGKTRYSGLKLLAEAHIVRPSSGLGPSSVTDSRSHPSLPTHPIATGPPPTGQEEETVPRRGGRLGGGRSLSTRVSTRRFSPRCPIQTVTYGGRGRGRGGGDRAAAGAAAAGAAVLPRGRRRGPRRRSLQRRPTRGASQ